MKNTNYVLNELARKEKTKKDSGDCLVLGGFCAGVAAYTVGSAVVKHVKSKKHKNTKDESSESDVDVDTSVSDDSEDPGYTELQESGRTDIDNALLNM